MRNIFLSLLIFTVTTQVSFAGRSINRFMLPEKIEQLCRDEASEYGSKMEGPIPKSSIHEECKAFITTLPSKGLKHISQDGSVSVTAGLNIIYIDESVLVENKKQIKSRVIAGNMSKLENIELVTISKDKKWIAVLHQILNGNTHNNNSDKSSDRFSVEKEILIFKASLHGNVSPYRILRDKEINSVTSMVFHPNGEFIYMTNKNQNSIMVFSAESDFRMFDPNKKSVVQKLIEPSKDTFREPASIEFMGNSLLVLDATQTRLVSLNLVKNEIDWTLEKESIGLTNVDNVRYEEKNKKLFISDTKGNSVTFDQK